MFISICVCYVYVCICWHVYLYENVYVRMCMCMCISVCVHVYIVCIYVCVYVCACVYVCICVCMCICVCVYMSVCICVRWYTHIYYLIKNARLSKFANLVVNMLDSSAASTVFTMSNRTTWKSEYFSEHFSEVLLSWNLTGKKDFGGCCFMYYFYVWG